jgi:transcriptional regulator with XRE-family HTH domain
MLDEPVSRLPLDDDQRRRSLRHFLIERRARLKPADVGLPSHGHRRCPGLRREEVAELVGVSATWYTLFEMARGQRRPSVRMVERVAYALRLDDRDRMQLMHLAIPELARASSGLEAQLFRGSHDLLVPLCRAARRLANLADGAAAERAAMEEVTALQPHYVRAEHVRIQFGRPVGRTAEAQMLVPDAAIMDAALIQRLHFGNAVDLGKGIACAPVFVRGQLHAVVVVGAHPEHVYAAMELRLLEAVAALLGTRTVADLSVIAV